MKLFSLKGNARVCISLFPLWAVPYTVYMYYLSLYLEGCGLAAERINDLMVVSNFSALFFSLFAGRIVDRMGRRYSTLIFDICSSLCPVLILMLRPSFPFAVLAMFLMGMNRIMSIGYYLLMIEDGEPDCGVGVMNLFNLILLSSGFFVPLGGIIVETAGLILGEKMLLAAAFILMTIQLTVRHFLTHETQLGVKMKAASLKHGWMKDILVSYKEIIVMLAGRREIRNLVLINAVVSTYYTVATTNSLLFGPYFVQYLGLDNTQYSLVGAVSTACILFSMVFINPRITGANMKRIYVVSCFISFIGFFLISGFFSGMIVIFSGVGVMSVAYGTLKTIGDGAVAVCPVGGLKSSLYSFSFIVSSVLSIIAVKVAGWLSFYVPSAIFHISAILMLWSVACVLQERHQISKSRLGCI